ncbi:hypothetical protein GCM10010140_65370 [Streptosporangium pseudovulgare]|uniref:Uncharacterized protein n=1 Tax=Streptosporangium pseudovulgare TaxID=35765 RepID=A0ABQ2RDA1_9ACTN|nr:hypothetical protein GCM10010140_65370 [Streptosporangium pseudovulgare]
MIDSRVRDGGPAGPEVFPRSCPSPIRSLSYFVKGDGRKMNREEGTDRGKMMFEGEKKAIETGVGDGKAE